jgi:hypothetical protein
MELDFLLDKGIGPAMMLRLPIVTRFAMNRRALICGLGSLVALLPTSGYAQSSPGRRWDVIPEIAVISTESDYRLPAIREAVHFWNAELSKLGSPFRLGSLVHVVVQAIPPGDLRDSADPLAATTRTAWRRF